MVRPGLVIFDCDGVLVDSEYLDNVATVAYLAELGLTISLEESERLFTGLSNAAIAEAVEARLGSPVPPTFAADLAATIYEKLAASGLRAIPGALHSVRAVANAGIPICVASNGEVAKMEMTLAKTGLIEHFAGAMFSREHVERGKPAPDVFLHAAAAMAVVSASCVVVEDSRAGVQGAMEAGMRVLGYAPQGDVWALSDVGAEVFASMAEVPGLLGL